MAFLIDNNDRIVPTWLEASRYLNGVPGRISQNLVLEIANPRVFTPKDDRIMNRVDASLRSNSDGLSISTVANTIFPNRLYTRHGHPHFYARYLQAIERGQITGHWGTYAKRLMSYPLPDGNGYPINPLEQTVNKLKKAINGERRRSKSIYEMATTVPSSIGLDEKGVAEIPLYIARHEGNKVGNMPCLSHLTIKLLGEHIHLTAIYRSHHYCSRALGNLVGLSNLLAFLASETGGQLGSLTCVSTHAELDVKNFGGARATRLLLEP